MDIIKGIRSIEYWREHINQEDKSERAWQQWRVQTAKDWDLDLDKCEPISTNTIEKQTESQTDSVDELITHLATTYMEDGCTAGQVGSLAELIKAQAMATNRKNWR